MRAIKTYRKVGAFYIAKRISQHLSAPEPPVSPDTTSKSTMMINSARMKSSSGIELLVIALGQLQGCSEATTESVPRGILLLPQFGKYHEPVNLVSNAK